MPAVLFDFGGTLAHVGLGRCVSATAMHFAETLGIMVAPEVLTSALNAAAEANRSFAQRRFYLYSDAFREGFLLTFTRLGVRLSEDKLAAMHAFLRRQIGLADVGVVDGARDTLGALRGRGLSLGIVSNVDQCEFRAVLRGSGLEDMVDFALSSEEAESCKPDPGIFRKALRRAKCAASEVPFVGDSVEHDVVGANRAGMPNDVTKSGRATIRTNDLV